MRRDGGIGKVDTERVECPSSLQLYYKSLGIGVPGLQLSVLCARPVNGLVRRQRSPIRNHNVIKRCLASVKSVGEGYVARRGSILEACVPLEIAW